MEYECPACGGSLTFDSKSQKIKCPFCDSEYEISQFEENDGMNWEVRPGSQWDEGEESSMEVYSCNSCGGEIVCEDTTVSTSCPYCGNPVVLKGKLSGMLKPDYVIPFKVSKREAIEKLKMHYKGRPYLPKSFKDDNHIEEIQGVYVPFWMFDGEAEGWANYKASRSHTHREGDYEVTRTEHFDVYREGSLAFEKVPVDASNKMPDDHMDSIEPFDYKELKPFSTAYLPGFLADKYDVSVEDSQERADSRCAGTLVDAMRDTVVGYDGCFVEDQDVKLKRGKVHYALLPVWMLTTKWKDKDYLFAMNGQTGKLVGDLPTSWGKFWATFGIITGVLTAALTAFFLLA